MQLDKDSSSLSDIATEDSPISSNSKRDLEIGVTRWEKSHSSGFFEEVPERQRVTLSFLNIRAYVLPLEAKSATSIPKSSVATRIFFCGFLPCLSPTAN